MATVLDQLAGCVGFQWDEGNAAKNWLRHRVSRPECEEVFFNEPLVAARDVPHSAVEPRYYVLGQSAGGRRLFVVCTIRNQLIRVVSARPMSRRERRVYDQASTKVTD